LSAPKIGWCAQINVYHIGGSPWLGGLSRRRDCRFPRTPPPVYCSAGGPNTIPYLPEPGPPGSPAVALSVTHYCTLDTRGSATRGRRPCYTAVHAPPCAGAVACAHAPDKLRAATGGRRPYGSTLHAVHALCPSVRSLGGGGVTPCCRCRRAAGAPAGGPGAAAAGCLCALGAVECAARQRCGTSGVPSARSVRVRRAAQPGKPWAAIWGRRPSAATVYANCARCRPGW
jgi:hypothetical protein